MEDKENIQTPEQENVSRETSDEIVVSVINGATPEEQLIELNRLLVESKKEKEALQAQLKDAQATNLHLAMTMSHGDGSKKETFESILREQPFYKIPK